MLSAVTLSPLVPYLHQQGRGNATTPPLCKQTSNLYWTSVSAASRACLRCSYWVNYSQNKVNLQSILLKLTNFGLECRSGDNKSGVSSPYGGYNTIFLGRYTAQSQSSTFHLRLFRTMQKSQIAIFLVIPHSFSLSTGGAAPQPCLRKN